MHEFQQSILQYVRAIFDTVLTEEFLPPPVRFIYQQIDEMADKNKVDADIVHAWKSMRLVSYIKEALAIRRIISLVDMTIKAKFSNSSKDFKIHLFG